MVSRKKSALAVAAAVAIIGVGSYAAVRAKQSAGAKLTITPDTAPYGTPVTVVASNFPADSILLIIDPDSPSGSPFGVTDASGTVSGTLTADPASWAVGVRQQVTVVTQDGVVSASASFTPVAVPASLFTLTILVASLSGQVLAGATVAAGGKTAQTNSQGIATLQLNGGTYTVTATASGYYQGSGSVDLVSDNQLLNIALTPTTQPPPSPVVAKMVFTAGGQGTQLNAYVGNPVVMAVQCLDSSGSPVAGVVPYLVENGVFVENFPATDSLGGSQLTVPFGAAGSYYCYAEIVQGPTNVKLYSNGVLVSVVVQKSAYTITFWVYDSVTFNSIAGAQLSVGGKTATTDATGHVSVQLAAGSYTLSVTATGYDPVSNYPVQVVQDAAVNVPMVNANPPPPGSLVSGSLRILDSILGTPIAGAVVSWTGPGVSQSKVTDPTGLVDLDPFPNNANYTLTVCYPGFRELVISWLVNQPGNPPISFSKDAFLSNPQLTSIRSYIWLNDQTPTWSTSNAVC